MIIAFGVTVANHVAEDYKPGQDSYKDLPSTVEGNVLEKLKKQIPVETTHAHVIRCSFYEYMRIEETLTT